MAWQVSADYHAAATAEYLERLVQQAVLAGGAARQVEMKGLTSGGRVYRAPWRGTPQA